MMRGHLSQLAVKRRWAVVAWLTACLVSFVGGASIAEAVVANPAMTLNEALGMQHLIEEGDMLIIVRYELPKTAWRVDAGDDPDDPFMEEAACFEADERDLLDLCWTSLLSGVASHTFYDGDQDGTPAANLVRQRTLPRIGHGISGVYIGTGHSLTFGNTSYETCLEGAAATFNPRTVACTTIVWNTITDTDGDGIFIDDAPAQNAVTFQDLANNLGGDLPGRAEAVVTNNLITPVGVIFFSEAFSNAVRSAPAAFAVSEQLEAELTLSNANTAAETDIEAAAAESRIRGWVSDFNTNRFGGTLSIRLVGGVFSAMVAILIGIAVAYHLRNLYAAVVMMALVMFGWGVLNGLFDFKLFLIVVLVLFSLSIFPFMKRVIP